MFSLTFYIFIDDIKAIIMWPSSFYIFIDDIRAIIMWPSSNAFFWHFFSVVFFDDPAADPSELLS
jgi:hypothetical protein